ncbi:Putative Geranylgeranyl pyrophosphate synthetase [[Torrubiella] hemipterigena]|uniref:Putative Geranylgeranyl pyrophosphate synthetase n=1 Tax=[Torrubiella] hemipterigena TaxID=1531966 RepID=A0A0A1TCJ1_9HYPO|nr:Putative Geranylgeranyl pyrophosphate synthetase [[Torrubiella] hemipterigena]
MDTSPRDPATASTPQQHPIPQRQSSAGPLSTPIDAIPLRTSSTNSNRMSSHTFGQQPSISSVMADNGVLPRTRAPDTGRKNSMAYIDVSAADSSRPPPRTNSGVMLHQQSPTSPQDPSRYAYEDLDFAPERSWTDDKEGIIRGPYNYLVSHPGKDIRSQLISAFDALLEVPPDSLAIITKVVGMLHESSLLVDDVQDSSELRRGFPVAHHIFGVPQTINSANYVYFVAVQELLKLNNPEALKTFADELVNLHRGQGMDLFWRDTLTCPSEDDYLEMVGNKTGGLFRLGIKLMQGESPHAATIDCVPLVNLIGLIFQIRDDYINLASEEYSAHKGMCEDLTEGKFSFPVIHSIRSNPSDLQLVSILKQKTSDVQVKRYAVTYMQRTGSFEYTRKVIATLIERARRVTMELDKGRGKADGVMKILDKFVVE